VSRDGCSTVGAAANLLAMVKTGPGLRVFALHDTRIAVLEAIDQAMRHCSPPPLTLLIDANGQHPADMIPDFMAASLPKTDTYRFGS